MHALRCATSRALRALASACVVLLLSDCSRADSVTAPRDASQLLTASASVGSSAGFSKPAGKKKEYEVSLGGYVFAYDGGELRDRRGNSKKLSVRSRRMIESLIEGDAEYEESMRLLAMLQRDSNNRPGPLAPVRSALSDSLRDRSNATLELSPRSPLARIDLDCGAIAEALIQHTAHYREVREEVNNMSKEFISGRYQDFMRERAQEMGATIEEAIERWQNAVPFGQFAAEWSDTFQASDLAVEVFRSQLTLTIDVALGYMQSPPCWPQTQPVEWPWGG